VSPRDSARTKNVTAASAPVTERGARTRLALVKAARALFEKQGYLDTNVGDISRRARVAHGTFYTYFSSKEEIFSEVADALVADVQRIADAEPHLTADATIAERLERSNRGYLRAYQANARMMAVLEQVATFNPRLAAIRRTARRFWVQRNTEAIRRWQDQGLVDPDLDPQYASSALGSMVDRSAYVWNVLQEPYEFERAVEQLTRLYCNALRVPYGAPGASLDRTGAASRRVPQT
jgi:AcrR family transcriptional regulator